MNQKSIQFPNNGMSEFSYYTINMEKYRQFPDSDLPYRFRVDKNSWNTQCLRMYKFP